VIERTVVGPAICQGCGEEVTFLVRGREPLGWLHTDGLIGCYGRHRQRLSTASEPLRVRGQFATKADHRRAYNREWMRRKRAMA